MKVVALGGCGEMGQVAVRTCMDYPFVTSIVIADRDGGAAAALAQKLGGKTSALALDITDQVALDKLLKDSDIVLATVGPYYKFGALVLKAAIKAKCHYIDICDDWEPTLDMLKLHSVAKDAGIIALLGVGASPGVANMLAVKAINELDQVDEVYTSFGATSRNEEEEGESSAEDAALEHWVFQFTGTIKAQIDGRSQITSPLKEVRLQYPKFGKVVCYSVGHPEPITLPVYYPGIKTSATLMVMSDFVISVLQEVRNKVDQGEMTIKQGMDHIYKFVAQDAETNLSIPELLRYFFYTGREILRGKNYLPAITAFASGTKEGRKTRVVAYTNGSISGGMGLETCIPTSVALAMIANGEISKKGVYAPEGCMDPDKFFKRLSPYFSNLDDPAHGPVRVISESY